MRNKPWLFSFTVLSFLLIFHASADAAGTEYDLQQANNQIKLAVLSAQQAHIEETEKQFSAFKTMWYSLEDHVKQQSAAAYRDIEDQMGQVEFALAQNPPNEKQLIQALEDLERINEKFLQGDYAQAANPSSPASSVKSSLAILDQALQHLSENQPDLARTNIEQFRKSWLDIESIVLTQSSTGYQQIEKDMVTAYAYLSETRPDTQAAQQTIQEMKNLLEPLVSKTSYTMFDAAVILLREGLEALLVIIALISFLKKSGNGTKTKWVWYGIGSGFAASIIIGFLVVGIFSTAAFGNNNFLISGWTGLFAAIMLLYMSYWLHSKSHHQAWNQYLSTKSTKALASGSLWSLSLLAFLAVFREGAETAVFFIGMASSISWGTLLSGIALGIIILILLAVMMIKIGVKIPMRPFFLASSLLVFYLSFKFLGMGIHGLQLGGILSATHIKWMPSIEFIALYPTWQNLVPQLLFTVFAAAAVLWNRRNLAQPAYQQHH